MLSGSAIVVRGLLVYLLLLFRRGITLALVFIELVLVGLAVVSGNEGLVPVSFVAIVCVLLFCLVDFLRVV